ncbi:Uncharacterised protein [Bordetella pertussis]|nr:Uncharacterised protein [Bordetella pertussis]
MPLPSLMTVARETTAFTALSVSMLPSVAAAFWTASTAAWILL